jgi:hypothetical protein
MFVLKGGYHGDNIVDGMVDDRVHQCFLPFKLLLKKKEEE